MHVDLFVVRDGLGAPKVFTVKDLGFRVYGFRVMELAETSGRLVVGDMALTPVTVTQGSKDTYLLLGPKTILHRALGLF